MLFRKAANFAGRYLHALALVGHTFTFGLASPKRRFLISRLAREAHFVEFPPMELPAVAIADLTDEETDVTLCNPIDVNGGGVTLLELLVLARLAREYGPARIFEIGTFHGRTTAVLAANTPPDCLVYTLDLPAGHATKLRVVGRERQFIDKRESGRLIHGSPQAGKIRQLYGDSATFDFSAYQADLVFIDGSHAYDYVMSDSRNALAMLRNGQGVLVWHDYGEWEGVTRALNELARADKRFAAVRHVRDTTLAVLDTRGTTRKGDGVGA
jgi:predicted O-methyltransferase YrrM